MPHQSHDQWCAGHDRTDLRCAGNRGKNIHRATTKMIRTPSAP
ncbi:hypothetical protein BZL29_0960 [Mycobacterium kansasii]|uniref:Uncharacterized protein n=1 Tax=Mycobacterium kansasii TaxID=1768 RepID=A0A1V3XW22_MYCKA|nr:hypothetical protein BZL29_0960 [Mycobacterium kansasii]